MISKFKRFRFHLSTALVLMLLAAGANWYYVSHYLNVPEPWEVAIRKRLAEKVTMDIEGEPSEVFREIEITPIMFSRKVWNEKKSIKLKVADLPKEQILNQLCEKFHTKWTVQQGAVFVCAQDEECPSWKSYDTDFRWSAETRTKLGKRFNVCYMDNDLSIRTKFYQDICRIPIVLDPAYKDLNVEPVMVQGMDMKMEHALHWACYYGDAEWSLRKGAEGKEEIYVTPKKPAGKTATSPSEPNATPPVSQK